MFFSYCVREVPNHAAIVWEIYNQEISIDCYRCVYLCRSSRCLIIIEPPTIPSTALRWIFRMARSPPPSF
ncbi:hypothetical protein IMY05_001G0109800 [Salix suchowensis]|nr:hypothetical protein IMY05_001G0109800 [Salix suchowensis]